MPLQVPVCSVREGFDSVQRAAFIDVHRTVTDNVPYMPRFTSTGFTKASVPADLYQKLLDARQAALDADEMVRELDPTAGVINFQAAVENKELGQSKMLYINRYVERTLKPSENINLR